MEFRPIRVVHYGLGAIGTDVARIIANQPSLRIVGAIDHDQHKVGRDVGEVIDLNRTLDAPVSNNAMELLTQTHPDVVVHATTSFFHGVYSQIRECIQARANVISTCEELVYPYASAAVLAAELNRLAVLSGVTVLGAGVNPGFVMDLLPLVLTAPCIDINRINVTRVVDATNGRPHLQQRIGAGLSTDQFRSHVASGVVRHVGLNESIHMLADGLNLRIERFTESIDPIIANDWIRAPHVLVAPGQVAGIRQVAQAWFHGRDMLTLTWQTSVGATETYDSIHIDATPPVDVVIRGGLHGDQAAAALLVHAIPRLLNAAPGLTTVLELPPIHYQPRPHMILSQTS
jgi:4-hydroxy-tetrahydrodipicolinate reductase